MTSEQLDVVEKDILANMINGSANATIVLRGLTEVMYGQYTRITKTLVTLSDDRDTYWIDVAEIASIVIRKNI